VAPTSQPAPTAAPTPEVSTRLSAGDALTRFIDAGSPLATAIKDAINGVGGAIGATIANVLSFFASLFGK
jgi:hypothetical protein